VNEEQKTIYNMAYNVIFTAFNMHSFVTWQWQQY